MSDDLAFSDKKLKALISSLKGKLPTVRVGILGGDKNSRKESQATNAAIGAKHEFGQDNMPMRSFLRMPLTDQMQRFLDRSGAFNEDALRKVLKTKSINEWVSKIATISEAIVQEAFASGGFGKWLPSNFENKRVHQTLVETQQLRNSITSKVDEK